MKLMTFAIDSGACQFVQLRGVNLNQHNSKQQRGPYHCGEGRFGWLVRQVDESTGNCKGCSVVGNETKVGGARV